MGKQNSKADGSDEGTADLLGSELGSLDGTAELEGTADGDGTADLLVSDNGSLARRDVRSRRHRRWLLREDSRAQKQQRRIRQPGVAELESAAEDGSDDGVAELEGAKTAR